MDEAKVLDLRRACWRVRRNIIEMIWTGGSGHQGGSLSCVEILTVLYKDVLRVDPSNPAWPERDRLVLSKGHASPALYAVLAEAGFYPENWLQTFNKNGTRLQKHIDMHFVPGGEVSTGSLGQGFSVAVGMALAARLDGSPRRAYAVLGDGECQEGQIWEAAMAASQLKLDNLIAYLDFNKLQCDGVIEQTMSIEPIEARWLASRWDVQRIDGHDVAQLIAASARAQERAGKPHMIICDTVKGKGVAYMESQVAWHAQVFNEQTYQQARKDLAAAEVELWPSA